MVSFNSVQSAAFDNFKERIPSIIEQTNYSEIYGYNFNTTEWTRAHDRIAYNFLIENQYNVVRACRQFTKTLEWRKAFKPLSAACLETHDERYGPHIVLIKQNNRVYNWNCFNVFKDQSQRKTLLGDTQCMAYIRWRIGLFEQAIALMDLESNDTHVSMDQIYDFSGFPGLSAFNLGSDARKTTKLFLDLVAAYYPGIVDKRIFVNTPILLSWVVLFFQKRVGRKAAKNFMDLRGRALASQLGNWVPAAYGGSNCYTVENLDCGVEARAILRARMSACGFQLANIPTFRVTNSSKTSISQCSFTTDLESISSQDVEEAFNALTPMSSTEEFESISDSQPNMPAYMSIRNTQEYSGAFFGPQPVFAASMA